MESIGEKLKAAREARKLSIKDVANDTNITPHYVEALEDEDFEKFPSETYLLGFLRSYSQYLKLDADVIIQSYRGYKIGESATPLEELTRSTRPGMLVELQTLWENRRYQIMAVIAVVVLGVAGLTLMVKSPESADIDESATVDSIRESYRESHDGDEIEKIRNMNLQNDSGFILLYQNEAVQFLVGKKEVLFLLRGIEKDSVTVEFLPSKKKERLNLDEPVVISSEGMPREITLTLKGLTESRAKIMVGLGKSLVDEEQESIAPMEEEQADTTSVIARDRKNLKIIFEAEFKQKSFVELYLDGQLKKRGFLPAGSVERWEASEVIQLKMGNAGGIVARINGKLFSFGKPGQVANKVISWKKDSANPNLYHIHVRDW